MTDEEVYGRTVENYKQARDRVIKFGLRAGLINSALLKLQLEVGLLRSPIGLADTDGETGRTALAELGKWSDLLAPEPKFLDDFREARAALRRAIEALAAIGLSPLADN